MPRATASRVYERAAQPGGLATWHDFGAFVWDRFYHVILPSDTALVEFMRRIGLGDRLRWRPTQTGFYVDRAVPSALAAALDFLRFPLLGLVEQVPPRRDHPLLLAHQRLEAARGQVTVEDFLVRYSGRATFEKIWKPLLLAKLGENYRRVSAVFIWTYVKRLFSARDAAAQKESARLRVGRLPHGVHAAARAHRARSAASCASGSRSSPCARARAAASRSRPAARAESFDKVIFTGPVNVLRSRRGSRARPGAAAGRRRVPGVVCLALVTRKPCCPYYVLNIADERDSVHRRHRHELAGRHRRDRRPLPHLPAKIRALRRSQRSSVPTTN